MRNLTITNQSWTVDDSDSVIDNSGRLAATDMVEAAGVSYSYARV